MKIKLNTPMILSGYRNPISSGKVVEVVNEQEAAQLINMGYAVETDAEVTYSEVEPEVVEVEPLVETEPVVETVEVEQGRKSKRGDK